MTEVKLAWTKQLGTPKDEFSRGVATDSSGNIYITGSTTGSLEGSNTGGYDAWVAKYDSLGNQQWIKQIGSSGQDLSWGIAVDGSSNIYIAGYTTGSLEGSNAGSYDAWVAKYDSSGNQQWIKQLGTPGDDKAYAVATDSSSNVYLSGSTTGSLASDNAGQEDAWVAKYDSLGNQQWIKQLGTSEEDKSWGMTTDSSDNIYITGRTKGALEGSNAGGYDAWVAKYDSQGNQQWIKQLGGSGDDFAYNIGTDSNSNIYITGRTTSSLEGSNAGGYDVWVAKYDSLGEKQWIKQLGSSSDDFSFGLAVDSGSNIYICGGTQGSLEGTNAGGYDAWVAKYDSSGNQQWIKQIGTSEDDFAWGVAVDSSGNIYATGHTKGSLEGSNAGGWDAWLIKFVEGD